MKFIGYKVKGQVYGIATHLGGVYISESQVNLYSSEKKLTDDFNQAKLLVSGKPYRPQLSKDLKWNKKEQSYKDLGGGTLFISKLLKPKQFKIQWKTPHEGVALRAQFTLKTP